MVLVGRSKSAIGVGLGAGGGRRVEGLGLDQALEQGLNELLQLTAKWLGLAPEAAGTVKVSREFGISANEGNRITEIGAARR